MELDLTHRPPEKPRIAVEQSNAKDADLSSIFDLSLLIDRIGENPRLHCQVDSGGRRRDFALGISTFRSAKFIA